MYDVLKLYILQTSFLSDTRVSNKKIYYHDILYIEIMQRHSLIHTVGKEIFKTTYTLKHWEELFRNAYLAQSHRAFLVNLQNIATLNNDEILLVNDERVPISRNWKEIFIKNIIFTWMYYYDLKYMYLKSITSGSFSLNITL